MSKIVCDVCGTIYPDSANQCPICGCAHTPEETSGENVANELAPSRRENYTYVKGGRFSKKNVKKRNQRINREEPQPVINDEVEEEEEAVDSGKGLVIAIVVLLLAVIAVASYITIRFFMPFGGREDQGITPPETTAAIVQTEEETVETTVEETVAVEIALDVAEVTLEDVGATHTLVVSGVPENSDVAVTFNSDNDAIATVSHEGVITAMSAGEVTVTVTYGDLTAQCKVICKFGEDSAATNSEFKAPYRLNKKDVTIEIGEKFTLKFIDADKNIIPVVYEIKDPNVCSMDGNTVKGLAKGNTVISVTYEGVTYTCKIAVVYQH